MEPVPGAGLGTGKVVALVFATGTALIATSTLTGGESGLATAAAAAPILAASPPTAAQPPTSTPAVPTAGITRFKGLAFDTCRAPSLAAMQAWRASPYRAVGVYISGSARACKHQPHLTREWVAAVSAAGWRLVPIDVSQQAPCLWGPKSRNSMRPHLAHDQGVAAARTAIRAAGRLGMLPGSALYSDIEHYGSKAKPGCVKAVADFLAGWTEELHRGGYLSGVYAHVGSGIPHAADRYFSGRSRPDAVWMAQWDRGRNLRGWPGVSDLFWADGDRIKQYRGDHTASWGGFALRIDANVVDAPVATVAGTAADAPPTVFGNRFMSMARDLWRRHKSEPGQANLAFQSWCDSHRLSPRERLAVTLERLHAFAPTRESYARSVARFRDISRWAEARYPRNFAYDRRDPSFPRLTDVRSQVDRIVLHYTEGLDTATKARTQARDMHRSDQGTGYNWFVNDRGREARVFKTSSQFTYHVKDRSARSLGVEVAACSQADVTARQYEQLLYLVANVMETAGVVSRDRPVAEVVERFVVGHREYGGAQGHADFPKVVTDPFRARLVDFLVDELGYTR
ncbi:MAG: glycoside hydrolase domain-containing protein [Sporichthyaceae bacterium]